MGCGASSSGADGKGDAAGAPTTAPPGKAAGPGEEGQQALGVVPSGPGVPEVQRSHSSGAEVAPQRRSVPNTSYTQLIASGPHFLCPHKKCVLDTKRVSWAQKKITATIGVGV